jgi:hypothetical protein
MSRRALILAVVVLLIASSALVLAPAEARGAAPVATHEASPHPAILGSIQLYTSSGECPFNYCNTTEYATGSFGDYDDYGGNTLYFGVYDHTGDTSANFTITDPNASRDGVGSPAFSVNVPLNTTTGEYQSYQTGISFTFPASIKIGGGWNVSVSAPLGGNASYPIFLQTYYEDIYGTPYPSDGGNWVLPGEPILTEYGAFSATNGAPDAAITNVSYYGTYYGANDTYQNLFSSPKSGIITQPAAALGSYTWNVPANATVDTDIYLEVWVSIYVGGVQAENESYGVAYSVGELTIQSFAMESNGGTLCPRYTDDQFASGSLVQGCAYVGAGGVEGGFTPVANLPVKITFWNGKANVTPTGFTTTTLTSNSTGAVTFSFAANSSQFSSYYAAPFYNSVNLTATNPGASSIAPPTSEVWWNYTFTVNPPESGIGVNVALDQLSYYVGQAITATWSIQSTDPSQTGPISAVAWYTDTDLGLTAQGPISSTASTGTFSVTVPSGYVGEFEVEVLATNATAEFYGEVVGYVTPPLLTLNPSTTAFTSGSTITIQAQAWGDAALSAPVISYQVFAAYGNDFTSYGEGGSLAAGTVANGSSITINVPSTGGPDSYTVYAYLSSAATGLVAATNLTITQSWGYNVFLGVTTASSYSDGSYQPGQTVTVSYQIAPYGNAPLPVLFTFTVGLAGTQISNLVSTPSTSGTFQLTIPSGWQTGVAILQVQLQGTYLAGNSCAGGICEGMSAITINAHPSALSMEIGAGSGLTVGWLILLILVIVVFVVLLVLILRKRSTPPSGGAPPVTTPMTPPAPAPSSPGAAEWVEPSSSPPASSGQPPMPSPPPGAT